MVTNVHFNNFGSRAEKKLIEDLIVESIRVYGHDCYYCPRVPYNTDDILNEHQYYAFTEAYQIELYVKNFDSFEGDGALLQKFGLETRDQMTLVMSIRAFDDDIKAHTDLTIPREGDLIFIPFLGAGYQIKFLNTTSLFYQMGDLQVYELVCELFEYSQEPFATGVSDIDFKYNAYSSDSTLDSILLESSNTNFITTERNSAIVLESYDPDPKDSFADNEEFQIESDQILDFTERDPFSEGGTY